MRTPISGGGGQAAPQGHRDLRDQGAGPGPGNGVAPLPPFHTPRYRRLSLESGRWSRGSLWRRRGAGRTTRGCVFGPSTNGTTPSPRPWRLRPATQVRFRPRAATLVSVRRLDPHWSAFFDITGLPATRFLSDEYHPCNHPQERFASGIPGIRCHGVPLTRKADH